MNCWKQKQKFINRWITLDSVLFMVEIKEEEIKTFFTILGGSQYPTKGLVIIQ